MRKLRKNATKLNGSSFYFVNIYYSNLHAFTFNKVSAVALNDSVHAKCACVVTIKSCHPVPPKKARRDYVTSRHVHTGKTFVSSKFETLFLPSKRSKDLSVNAITWSTTVVGADARRRSPPIGLARQNAAPPKFD